MHVQESKQSFRLVSIESLENLETKVRKVAADHGFQLNCKDATTQIAPFCGHNYFFQEMTLSDCSPETDPMTKIEKCLAAIEELTEEALADGYVEVIQARNEPLV